MKTRCYKCGFEKEMTSDNLWFEAAGRQHFMCDECKTTVAVSTILKALSGCQHLIDLQKIEKILKIVVE